MAFGGVEIGSDMAQLAAMAIPINTVGVPPIIPSLSPIPTQTTVKIGIRRAAVAVFDIKLLSIKQTKPLITKIMMGLNSPKGMLLTALAANPVWFMALPRRSEEHTSELQSRQYLVCRLLLEKKTKNT